MKVRWFAPASVLVAALALVSCEPPADVPGENRAPAKPVLLTPANDAMGVALTPTLTWKPAADPDNDTVTYKICYGTISPPSRQAASSGCSCSITTPLTASTVYYWKVMADDGNGGTTYSEQWSFRTQASGSTNHPPSVPTMSLPANGAMGVSLTPTLSWQASTDPDGDQVAYAVCLGDSDPPPCVDYVAGTSYTVSVPLSASTVYYWQVVAGDEHGSTAASAQRNFTTRSAVNHPPSAPTLKYPYDGVTGVWQTALSWEPSTDPDGDTVTYQIHLGQTDPPPLVDTTSGTSYPLMPVMGETSYWSITATDGNGGSTSSMVRSFTSAADCTVLEDFESAPLGALTLGGWVVPAGASSAVSVVGDVTGYGFGQSLELSDFDHAAGDVGAVAYSPVIPELLSQNLTTDHAVVTARLSFYLVSGGSWFVLGKTRAESFVMNNPAGSLDAYENSSHTLIPLAEGTWYTLDICFNSLPGKYDVLLWDGSTLVGSILAQPFDAADNYDAYHFTSGGSSDGRLMFGSWFSYAGSSAGSWGDVFIDAIEVIK